MAAKIGPEYLAPQRSQLDVLIGSGDVPMPVILIGALGGLITSGILGLFIGPAILAIGYELFWQWVDTNPYESEPSKAA